MRLLIHFARFGPYHHARLKAAHEVLAPLGWEVLGLETAGTDATYAWDEAKAVSDGPRVVTAFPGRVHEEIRAAEYRAVLPSLLESLKPDAMAIAGWGSTDAVTCLSWCRRNDVRRILMSETRAADGRRVWWKERVKRYLISRFDGALVGSKSHRDYLVSLGMKPERIAFGYNVVDNEYFRNGRDAFTHASDYSPAARDGYGPACGGPPAAEEVGRIRKSDPTPYFLASNRFIERKNLLRLTEAYARYLHSTSNIQQTTGPWHLCLLGDGEQKPALIAKCHELGLIVIESAPWEVRENVEFSILNDECNQPAVYFPGFRQIDELPRFYAHAGCFIHPAMEEPWGLVINEAMACGLPVLSSNNVGAAEELVEDGVNGWKFDPTNVEELAHMMSRISAAEFPYSAFSSASCRILEERAPTRAFGKGLADFLQR